MFGAILGDMIGAPYEFDRGGKTKTFPLFSRESQYTDDSVMTIAVAESLLDTLGQDDDTIRAALIRSMQKWGRRYPDAGYGGMFYCWLRAADPKPYGSFGNGSAMRVSSAGWLFDSLPETRHAARLTAEVTHNHPEGIKGAEAIASAIYLARNGSGKDEIRDYIAQEFGYDLTRTCDEIRPTYYHVETCQKTVPEAITVFLEGEDFEDVIRTAVSLGGDCDTLTCIAGSIAEAFYGVPQEMIDACRDRLPDDMLRVLDRFQQETASIHDAFLFGNETIEAAINKYRDESTKENLIGVLEAIRIRMHANGHFMIPVITTGSNEFAFRTLRTTDGKEWLVAFTTHREYSKGEPSQILSNFIDTTLRACIDNSGTGFIINPWENPFMLSNELVTMMFEADAQCGVPHEQAQDTSVTPKLVISRDECYNSDNEGAAESSIAKKSDWNTEPMSEQHESFVMYRKISPEQMAFLRRGHIPQEMEDKWFWYMEGDTLYAHRSWTGICVFILQFDPDSNAIHVTVNRNPEQFTSDGIQEDEEAINHLLDWWTQPHYDYYHEWLSETLRTLKKQGMVSDDPLLDEDTNDAES